MMCNKPNLQIDTSCGLPPFVNDELIATGNETSKWWLKNIETQIKQLYISKIKESIKSYKAFTVKQDVSVSLLTENLTIESHRYISDELGPDQSYLGKDGRGEYNSIEIYLNILKAMWNDYIPPKVLHKRMIIKRGLNKQHTILLKSWLHRWKMNSKIIIGPTTPLGFKGFKGFKAFVNIITN